MPTTPLKIYCYGKGEPLSHIERLVENLSKAEVEEPKQPTTMKQSPPKPSQGVGFVDAWR